MREQKVNNQLSRRPKEGCRITPLAASAFRSNWVLFRNIYDLYESRTGKRWSRKEVSDLNRTTTQAPPAARLCRSRSEDIFSFLHMFASRATTGVFKLPTSTAGAHPHQSRQRRRHPRWVYLQKVSNYWSPYSLAFHVSPPVGGGDGAVCDARELRTITTEPPAVSKCDAILWSRSNHTLAATVREPRLDVLAGIRSDVDIVSRKFPGFIVLPCRCPVYYCVEPGAGQLPRYLFRSPHGRGAHGNARALATQVRLVRKPDHSPFSCHVEGDARGTH